MAVSINALDFGKNKVSLGQNFLILGSDAYLADVAINHIKNSLKKLDIDTSIVYGDEVKAGELGEYLDTFTIFSSSKLVIIRNAEAFNKRELEVIGDYFDGPSEIQTVVILAEKIKKTMNVWKKVLASTLTVNCDPPRFAGEMRTWLMMELRKIGKVMTPQAIADFTARVELDYYSAANELTKIHLLVGDRKQITQKDLASLSSTRAGTLIDFYRAMGRRQTKAALQAVDLMLDADWELLQVLYSMTRFFMNLWKIQLLRQRHITDSEISRRHLNDIYTSQRREYLGFARNYSLESLEKIMKLLLDADHKLKSSSIDKRLHLDLALIKILDK